MSFKFYARIKDSVLQQGYGLDEESFNATKEQYLDNTFIEVDSFCSPDTHYFKDGIILKKPEKPLNPSFWDNNSFTWIENSQLKENEVKISRNRLLNSSDWTQLPRVPLTAEKQDEWEVYRQALRDVTKQSGYPFNVVWPVKPS